MLPMKPTRWNQANPEADPVQCGRFRADFTYELDGQQRVLLLDYDENAHRHYVPTCELSRQLNLAVGFGRPVTFIRYNPDAIRIGGVPQGIKSKQREELLLERMGHILTSDGVDAFEHFLTIEYLFYYNIPGATRTGHVQTVQFKTTVEYETWAQLWLESRKTRFHELVSGAVQTAEDVETFEDVEGLPRSKESEDEASPAEDDE